MIETALGYVDALPWQLLVAALSGVFALLAAAVGWRYLFPARSEVALRLERALGRSDEPDQRMAQHEPGPVTKLLSPLAWLVRPTRQDELSRLRARVHQAGLRGPFAMEVMLAMKVILAAVPPIAFYQVNGWAWHPLQFPLNLVLEFGLCAGGYMVPSWWLRWKLQNRQRAIVHALPDATDLMVTCVEAGLSLDSALARVAQEIGIAAPILGSELNLTFLEIQAGIRRADAFRRLADRTGVEDLRSLSAMLIQTEMFGTSVARAFRVHAESMRVRRMQRAEEKAAKVGVKMTIPLVLCILPALMAVVLGPAVVSIFEKILEGK